METPNFDKIATNREYERSKSRRNEVIKWSRGAGLLTLVCCFAYISAMGFEILGHYDEDFKRERAALDTIGPFQIGSVLLLTVLGIMFIELSDDVKEEEKKNAKARKMFLEKIVNEYGIKDFDVAKNLGEYLLSYMGTEDKKTIEKEYQKLDLDDPENVNKFVELVRRIVTKVIDKHPDVRQTIPVIAEGKTYMFNPLNYAHAKQYGSC